MLCEGVTLKDIAKVDGMPVRSTIYEWRLKYTQFSDMYARAKLIQMENFEDDILETAANGAANVNHARLVVDTKKWIMSKRDPKQYGDKQAIEHTGAIQHNVEYKCKLDD